MIRVPSTGNLVARAKSTGDLRSLCNATAISEASTLLTATATIVTATASIADSSHSTVALVGAVASMIGASASLLGHVSAATAKTPTVEVVQIVERAAGPKGVLLGGIPILSSRRCRRVDLRILAEVDKGTGIGDCTWDGPGADGVYVNGLPEDEKRQGLDISVVGTGSFDLSASGSPCM